MEPGRKSPSSPICCSKEERCCSNAVTGTGMSIPFPSVIKYTRELHPLAKIWLESTFLSRTPFVIVNQLEKRLLIQ